LVVFVAIVLMPVTALNLLQEKLAVLQWGERESGKVNEATFLRVLIVTLGLALCVAWFEVFSYGLKTAGYSLLFGGWLFIVAATGLMLKFLPRGPKSN
jgi:hypothetical protein